VADVAELRGMAKLLQGWAEEIKLDSYPAPYATSREDIAALEKAAKLMEDAANEIEGYRKRDQTAP